MPTGGAIQLDAIIHQVGAWTYIGQVLTFPANGDYKVDYVAWVRKGAAFTGQETADLAVSYGNPGVAILPETVTTLETTDELGVIGTTDITYQIGRGTIITGVVAGDTLQLLAGVAPPSSTAYSFDTGLFNIAGAVDPANVTLTIVRIR